MKVLILAGGFGTRLQDQDNAKPKPMVEIGGRPIIWHIMRHFAHYGFKEFVVALGYRGEAVKSFFLDYYHLNGSATVNLGTGEITRHGRQPEDWIVHLIDTGLNTMTGGRVKRLEPWLKGEMFMLTYGDGVSDLDLSKLLRFHQRSRSLVTVTAVRPPARFGGLAFDGDMVSEFIEKPQIGEGWINGGFMVCEPGLFNYLKDDDTSLEVDALESIANDKKLAAFRHEGFWQCMDTPRDVRLLESLWQSGGARWQVWKE